MRAVLRSLALGSTAFLAAFLAARPAMASSNNAAVSGAQFLRLGAGARAFGMGDAFTPVAEGPDAIYWNPAGLARMERPELSYSHLQSLSFFHYDYFAYAQPVAAIRGTIGASATLFYQDPIAIQTALNQNAGSFRPHSEAVSVALGRAFVPFAEERSRDRSYLSQHLMEQRFVDKPLHFEDYPWGGQMFMGLAVKAITETLSDRTAYAFAADGGAIYIPEGLEALRLSAAFRNVGTKEKFYKHADSLPAVFNLGLAYDSDAPGRRLLTVLEGEIPYYGSAQAKLGVEYSWDVAEGFRPALRGGYQTLTAADLGFLSGFTTGLGLQYGRLSVDFAFRPMAELGNLYRLSVNVRF